jgi:MYXO-CTERM domain-containing protein
MADDLVTWVTDQSVANYLAIGETYDPTTADYTNNAPMVGFGPGLWILAINHRQGTWDLDAACGSYPDGPGDDDDDDSGSDDDDAQPDDDDAQPDDDDVQPDDDDSGTQPDDDDVATDDDDASVREPPPGIGVDGCGCGLAEAPAPSSLWLLLAVGLVARRR